MVLEILLEDLESFFRGSEYSTFLSNIKRNTMRYVNLFSEAADQIELASENTHDQLDDFNNALDAFRMNTGEDASAIGGEQKDNKMIKLLKRKFQLVIVPGPNYKVNYTPLRLLKSSRIGGMVETKAMVVRVSEVKPLINVACYLCEICGYEIYQKIHAQNYTPIVECPSKVCMNNNSRGRVIQNFAVSKFESFQEIKVQETSDQTPIGSIPRSFIVNARGALTRKCVPGDIISLCGVYLPHQGGNKKRFRDPLIHETFIEAFKIEKEKKTFNDVTLEGELAEQIQRASQERGIYEKVAIYNNLLASKINLPRNLRHGRSQKSTSSSYDRRVYPQHG